MNLINNLFEGAEGSWSGGIAHILIIISIVIALGRILGKTKIYGISFGATWVLFVGILFGHYGLTIDHELIHFLKEFGLVLFVYSIGLQVGPGFFSSFRSGGLALNVLTVFVIATGVLVTIGIYFLTGIPATTITGIMSGAVTNTPGLGAAQQAYFDTTGNTATDMAQGYAVAYPLGVIGCILSFVLIRMMLYRISGAHSNIASHNKVETKGSVQNNPDQPNLIPIFIGIALGCILGSIPITFPGIPQPVKLGLAGGPLIVSILISHFGPRFHVITYTTPSANLMIREIGISLFLACVGLEAGDGFVDTLIHGDGMKWILYGALITVIPVLAGGLAGRYILKLDMNTLTGVLSGACTNPPALAYASEQDRDSDKTGVAYATVYPLSMFLRVLAAQLMVLFFC
ncbi:MAG: transporter [Bacteroidales bacterium]|nr:transporter [Bacteroidales bacterium]